MNGSMYHYQATNAQGVMVRGHLESSSEQAVYRHLQAQDLLPVEISIDGDPQRKGRNKKLTAAMRTQSIREIATLLNAGVSLSEALPSLRKGHTNTPPGRIFDALHAALRSGESFADSLLHSKLPLPPDVLQIIRAGEASGQLGRAMSKALERLEYIESSRRELQTALIYPSILIVSGLAAITLIFAIVVPRFYNILSRGGAAVPWISRVVLGFGMFLNQHWMPIFSGLLIIIGLFWALLQQPKIREFSEWLLLQIPGVGGWILQTEMGRWTHSLGSLLASRIPLSKALALSVDAVSLASLKSRLASVLNHVRSGERLTYALQRQQLIDPMGANLLRVGEQSGRLSEVLDSLAKLYNEASRQRMKRFLLLLEPISILFIGSAIGTLMIAIMLGITSLNNIVLQ